MRLIGVADSPLDGSASARMASKVRRQKTQSILWETLIDFGDGTAPQPLHGKFSDGGTHLIGGDLPSNIPIQSTLWLHGKVRRACTTGW
jgi:hypothetical protein